MSTSYESAISLLQDTVVTFYAGSEPVGDTGVLQPSWGSGTTAYIDKMTVKQTMSTADHSAGQNPNPIYRATKYDYQTDVEMKLFDDSTQKAIFLGQQFKIVGVSTINSVTRTVTLLGIITDIEEEHGTPSTWKFTMKPYAVGGAAPYTVA